MAKKPTIEHVEASLKKWRTRMKRAMTVIQKLERQYARLVMTKPLTLADRPRAHTRTIDEHGHAQAAKPESLAVTIMKEMVESKPVVITGLVADTKSASGFRTEIDTTLPDFLKRGIAAQKAVNDVIAAEQIKAEQAETKRKKTAGRIAKMKAVKSGETKKMPLTGKAALAAIDSD